MEKFESFQNNNEKSEDPIEFVMTAEAYAKIEHESPYVFEVSGENTNLMYFGAGHSFSPEDAMFADIKQRFKDFDADIVLVEGMNDLKDTKVELAQWLREHSEEEAILEAGEPGFALKLAVDKNIDVMSPEPRFSDELESLEEQGFSRDEIFAYYFYRMIPQWHRQEDKSDVREYLASTVKALKQSTGWEDYDFSFDHAIEIGKKLWGEDMSLEDENFFDDRVDPIPWEEKRDSQDAVNLVARASSRYRDQYMVQQIGEVLKAHKRPFVVFGGSHAVMQEPAIRKLMEKSEPNES